LAKRIEAGEMALLSALCRVPLVVAQVRQWGAELGDAKLRLRDLIDLSMFDGGLVVAQAAAPVTAAELATDAADDDEGPDSLAMREEKLMPGVTARLKKLSAFANEIALLSGKRVAAVTRGRNILKRNAVRLGDLLAGFAGELEAFNLHSDRIADLI